MNEKRDDDIEFFRENPDGALSSEAVRKARGSADTFLRLSRVLIGADALDLALPPWLGATYHATLREGAGKGQNEYSLYTLADIDATLEAFALIEAENPEDLEEAVRKRIVASGGAQSVVAKSIIALWYCAALIDLTPPQKKGQGYLTMAAPKETFGEALVWKTMGANPMGIPGPYYGNWSYPATTLITKPRRKPET